LRWRLATQLGIHWNVNVVAYLQKIAQKTDADSTDVARAAGELRSQRCAEQNICVAYGLDQGTRHRVRGKTGAFYKSTLVNACIKKLWINWEPEKQRDRPRFCCTQKQHSRGDAMSQKSRDKSRNMIVTRQRSAFWNRLLRLMDPPLQMISWTSRSWGVS